jgi:glycosyltransferase involved in cell wall biosynthesis
VEVLRALSPEEHGIASVTVWGGARTLERISPRRWLALAHVPELDGPLPARVGWKSFRFTALALRGCDVLLVPGGTYLGAFRPFVAVSQNLLPFEPGERARYGVSWMRAKLALLERTQSATFRRAAATVFMSETCRALVERRMGGLPARTVVVPHGISTRFRAPPRPQEPLEAYSPARPFRWLYVSVVDQYKHPWHLARAVALLRERGLPVELQVVGPATPGGEARLRGELARLDPAGTFLHYDGPAPYDELPAHYRRADGFAYASSCESFGQTLVEAMSAGIPVACARRSTMPELLRDHGAYFDPEDPEDIARALEALLRDRDLRQRNVAAASRRAGEFTWDRCARDTFAVITDAWERHAL